MTPEEELELLIEQQRKDDTYRVWHESHVDFSLDDPLSNGIKGTIGDFVGLDEDGFAKVFRSRWRGRVMGPGHPGQHGLQTTYTNHGCRCPLCRTAQAAYQSEWYRKNRLKPLETRVCAHCDDEFETNQPHATFCSSRCRSNAWYARRGAALRKERRALVAA